MYGTNLFK